MAPYLLVLALLFQDGSAAAASDAPVATAVPRKQDVAPLPIQGGAVTAPTDDYGYVGWCYGAISAYVDLYGSSDGVHFEKVLTYGSNIKWIFEAPRLTAEGRLLCVATTRAEGPAILLWPGNDLLAQPEYIRVPEPEGASFPYGESTWYQLDSGRIMVFWRDEGASCRVYVNHSDDGGRTWSTPVLSDIPDSMSRLYAGRLSDGRFYLVNNAIPTLLDRRPLMLLLSDDGVEFNDLYMINDSPVEMRRKGLLKINGHQYPCCLVDGDRLFVAYDANKEDIMCEVIDATMIPRVTTAATNTKEEDA